MDVGLDGSRHIAIFNAAKPTKATIIKPTIPVPVSWSISPSVSVLLLIEQKAQLKQTQAKALVISRQRLATKNNTRGMRSTATETSSVLQAY